MPSTHSGYLGCPKCLAKEFKLHCISYDVDDVKILSVTCTKCLESFEVEDEILQKVRYTDIGDFE